MEIIDRIHVILKERGITANKLTREAGLNSSAMTQWKQGKSQPGVDAIVRIARYLKVSSDYLLGLAEEH